MNRHQILQQFRDFIVEEANLDDPTVLDRCSNMFEEGLVDSLFVVTLVAFCESTFGCELETAELSAENFATPETLADFVCARLEAREQIP
ncbi:MAG: acyl carrier protein [Verrucomicrobia bacterium]|nr:acyl carrier protein [Verrucomicrobiota bacterium]